jgi:hypothetical protein
MGEEYQRLLESRIMGNYHYGSKGKVSNPLTPSMKYKLGL